MMKVIELYEYIDSFYPRELSCEWDNDGIMCCPDSDAEVKRVLISLDATIDAVRYASEYGFNVLLTHHPMVFKKLSCVSDSNFVGRRLIYSLLSGITVMSFHTRLDAGIGGVNDCLVKALGFDKVVKDHNNEIFRIFDLPHKMPAEEFATLCKSKLGSQGVRLTGTGPIGRVCVIGGAGGDFVSDALNYEADMLLTGECSYNEAQDAFEKGVIVLEAGHYHTEAPVCNRLAELVNECGLKFEIFESVIHKTF